MITYDALNRVLTTGTTSNVYNGDGMLVAQTQNSVTTRYTHDLAAPLSQILSDGTQHSVYGMPAERLFAQQNTTKTWYRVDALNSVRALLDDAGIPQNVANYDAWGVPETSAIAPFGFTGELQHGSDVWLRARWYGAGRAGFASRDPYAGDAQTPYSLQYYQYGYSNPVSNRDPSGRKVQGADVQVTYANKPGTIPVSPLGLNNCDTNTQDSITLNFTDLGIILGAGIEYNLLFTNMPSAIENVYDLLSFSRADFRVTGPYTLDKFDYIAGYSLQGFGGGGAVYFGGFYGLSSYDVWSVKNYAGLSEFGGGSIQTPFDFVSTDFTSFRSYDKKLYGTLIGFSGGISPWPLPVSVKGGYTNAEIISGSFHMYRTAERQLPDWWHDGRALLQDLQADPKAFGLLYARAYAVVLHNAYEWEELAAWQEKHPGLIWRNGKPLQFHGNE